MKNKIKTVFFLVPTCMILTYCSTESKMYNLYTCCGPVPKSALILNKYNQYFSMSNSCGAIIGKYEWSSTKDSLSLNVLKSMVYDVDKNSTVEYRDFRILYVVEDNYLVDVTKENCESDSYDSLLYYNVIPDWGFAPSKVYQSSEEKR